MKEINIAQSIINKRKERGLTQDELAEYIGVTKASVSKWETGLSYPDIVLLPRLATYFDISIDELMGYSPQLTKENIKSLYLKFSADFASKPFEEVMAEVSGAIRKFYSCYPFLLQMVVLLLNYHSFADGSEKQSLVLEKALAICRRIKEECKDVYLTQQTISLEAMLHLMLQQPTEAIDLLYDTTNNPLNQDEMVLASAYEMRGDIKAAKRTLQVASYQYVLFLIGSAVKLLPLYADENDRFEEILQRGIAVADAFNIKTLHPNACIQLTLTAACYLSSAGDYERAIAFIEKSVDAYKNFKFPVIMQCDDYFDLLGDWFGNLALDNNAPMDAKSIKKGFLETLKIPPFAPLFELPEYKNILARVEKFKEL